MPDANGTETPPSSPEMWLLFVVGFGSAYLLLGLLVAFDPGRITAQELVGIGLGVIGGGILGYLWYTRENYKDALIGERNA